MRSGVLLALLTVAGCCPASAPPTTPAAPTAAEVAPVLETYASILYAAYDDSVQGAVALEEAVAPLTTGTASEAALTQARAAWITARFPYMQTEVGRFSGGPIDDATGYEAQINSWPLDEAFIDYVVDGDGNVVPGGLIHDRERLPTITAQSLTALHQVDSEESLAIGFHAIEFLLWGQDRSSTGPGARPVSDFVPGEGMDADRRRAYLDAVSHLLIAHLTAVRDAWAPSAPNYRAAFVALPPTEGLRRILLGMGSLAGGELAGDRINVPYTTQEQEDEHSCFSDTTLNDFQNDARGLRNIYLGHYTRTDGTEVSGASLSQLVAARDPALDARMRDELDAAVTAIEAIPSPFDQAILGSDETPGRRAIAGARQALRTLTASLASVAELFDVQLHLEG